MLTGRYQQRFGHEYNLPVTPEPGDVEKFNGMHVKEKTIADHLKASGYRTGLIGKWHLGLADQFHPNNRGFDEFYGLLGGGRSYWEIEGNDTQYTKMRRNDKVEKHEGYLTDRLGEEAISFIDRNKENPFFLYLSYTAVHAPMEAKPEHEKQLSHITDKNRRTLAGMTLALDESVGQVLAALDEKKLTKNTLIVFLNDNGGPSDANYSINKPFSGVKGTFYEGGVRVPFTMSWPGKIKPGTSYDEVISSLDIVPTALAAANAEQVGERALDGVDLLPYLNGSNESKPHQTLFWRRAAFAAVRDGDHKLVRYPDRPAVLYDVTNDIGEHENIADDNPLLVRNLMKKLFAWETELQQPMFLTHTKWIKQNRERYSKYTDVDKQ
jgi:arylsulfatase A-like enzyme